jgi:hypothetical protein
MRADSDRLISVHLHARLGQHGRAREALGRFSRRSRMGRGGRQIAKPTGSKLVKGPAESEEICSVDVEEK